MTARSLGRAFDLIDDFLAVQGPHVGLDAVLALQEAVRVDAAARAVLRDRLAALGAAGHDAASGSVLLGVLVALLTVEEG